MALTPQDLAQIKTVVTGVVQAVVPGMVHKIVGDAMVGVAMKSDLDRMAIRLTADMNLVERDTFSRLDDHKICLIVWSLKRPDRAARLQASRPA
jgi:hypothetical protein